MQWITAIIAFAVTMFMLSVIVSVMVETVHRLRRTRHKGLKQLIEKLYVHSIATRLRPAGGATLSPESFAVLILENRATGEVEDGDTVQATETGRLNSIDSIPVEVFTQKLADLKLVLKDDRLKMEDVVADIAAKYVTFGQEMSVSFERKSRTIAVVCAMVLAVVAYVHPLNLARVYLKNPELAEQVARKSEDIEAQLKALDGTIDGLKANVTEDPATLEAAANEIVDAADDIKARIEALKAEGVPLGWPDGAGACNGESLFVQDCVAEIGSLHVPVPSAMNLVWLLFGGLLVGLGAPFWQQIIGSLVAANGLTQKLASIVNGAEPARGAVAAVAAVPAAAAPAPTAVQTFKVATEAGPIQMRYAAPARTAVT